MISMIDKTFHTLVPPSLQAAFIPIYEFFLLPGAPSSPPPLRKATYGSFGSLKAGLKCCLLVRTGMGNHLAISQTPGGNALVYWHNNISSLPLLT